MSNAAHTIEEARPTAPAPARPPYWGLDKDPADRPGVPKETAPHPLPHAHWTEPAQQVPTHEVLKRAGLARLTPVFGTAEPPRGLSGALRRIAYAIPDDKARHWVLLLVADRIDVIEHGDGLRRLLPAAVVVAGAAGLWLATRRPRRRSWLRALVR